MISIILPVSHPSYYREWHCLELCWWHSIIITSVVHPCNLLANGQTTSNILPRTPFRLLQDLWHCVSSLLELKTNRTHTIPFPSSTFRDGAGRHAAESKCRQLQMEKDAVQAQFDEVQV